MGRDSNPRYPCEHAGFQDRCLKPLGHPSNLLLLQIYPDAASDKRLLRCYVLILRSAALEAVLEPSIAASFVFDPSGDETAFLLARGDSASRSRGRFFVCVSRHAFGEPAA